MSKKVFSLTVVLVSMLLAMHTSVAAASQEKHTSGAAAGQERIAVCHITGVYDFGSGPVPIGHVISIAEPAYQSHIDHGDLETWQMRSLPNGRMVCTACTDPLDTDDDGDGYTENQGDCNDNNINVNPGASEVCNGIDDDCDGEIDEGVQNTYYQDYDGDTYGNPLVSTEACTAPSGYVSDNTDCDDTDANVHPGATEVCNGIDDDCDGEIDEGLTTYTYYRDSDGDTYGNPSVSTEACTAPPGYVSDNTDCDDNDANVHPGATEVCNDIDDDCDAEIDEGLTTYTYYADTDSDNYGDPDNSTTTCSDTPPAGYVTDNTDCDDTDAAINPGATEIRNGIDDDCDGEIDEGWPIVIVYFDCTEYTHGEYIAHFSYSSTQDITIPWGPDNIVSNFEKPIENFEAGFHLDAMQIQFDGRVWWEVVSNGVASTALANTWWLCAP